MFAGWNIEAAKVQRKVETVDVASTLSLLLGTKLPSGSVGKTLASKVKHVWRKGPGKIDGIQSAVAKL
jgi:hypothetical protein